MIIDAAITICKVLATCAPLVVAAFHVLLARQWIAMLRQPPVPLKGVVWIMLIIHALSAALCVWTAVAWQWT